MLLHENVRTSPRFDWLRLLACAAVSLGAAACGLGAGEEQTSAPLPVQSAQLEIECAGGYTVTDLTAVTGANVGYELLGISPNGAVTGSARPASSYSPLQVLSWKSSTGLSALGSLGGAPAQGNAINNAGQIAGRSYLAGNVNQHAFFYDPTTGFHDLGTFGGEGFAGSEAHGINASGTVVGYASLPSEHHHAFSWNGGTLTDLGINPNGYNSHAYAINDAGLIVGQADGFSGYVHAVKWSNGVLSDLGALGGTSVAYAVNNAGIAVGQASGLGITWLPVIFNGDGIVTEIPFLDDFNKGVAYGISDSGQIVGEMWPTPSSGQTRHHAFVSQAGVTYDLNDLVTDHSIELTSARAINAAGQIVGYGASAVDGTIRAFVLTPVSCASTRGFKSITTGYGTTTLDVPEDVTVGDVLLAALEVDDDPVTVTPPIGWTLVRDKLSGAGSENAYHAMVFAHRATTTEPTSYTFEAPAGVWVGLQIAAYHGVSGVDASASASGSGTSISAPSVVASYSNDILVAFYVDWVGGTWSTASGLTKRSDFAGNSLQDKILTAAGATGAKTATNTDPSDLAAITIALH